MRRLSAPLGHPALWLWPCVAACALIACQRYPFETREPRLSIGRQLDEVVQTVTPTDILFVIDNSGSMSEEITELRNNVRIFINELSESANDYQVGFITTDVYCNLPACADVSAGIPCNNCSTGSNTSNFCCSRLGGRPCEDLDTDVVPDGIVDSSTCDGGRLRAADNMDRIFERPPDAADLEAWFTTVEATVDSLGTQGTVYEAGLEAATRAIACAVGHADCPDPAVAQLNAGFVRPEADLVVIFLSDEDDCSFPTTVAYDNLTNNADPNEQLIKLCHPTECYAYHGVNIDEAPEDGLMDWAQRLVTNPRRLHCSQGATTIARTVNPPLPRATDHFVDKLIEYKGDIDQVRAAAILGTIAAQPGDPDGGALGFLNKACDGTLSNTPSESCGCWAGSSPRSSILCDVTQVLGQLDQPVPARPSTSGGCQALPGGRYLQFLEELEARRAAAGSPNETLVDSICEFSYSDTMVSIVNTVILSDCLGLGTRVDSAAQLSVVYNERALDPQDDPGSVFDGFFLKNSTAMSAPSEVCLTGDLSKEIGDRIQIFVLECDTAVDGGSGCNSGGDPGAGGD